MASAIKNFYISCACNRTPGCADWGYNGLLCFGTSNAVALCDLKHSAKIVCSLADHKDRVNVVRWIPAGNGGCESEFLSASLDKTAILWSRNENNEFRPTCKLEGHTGSVTAIDAVYLDPTGGSLSKLLVVSASADSTLKVWKRQTNESECICSQTVSLGNGLIISLSLTLLAHSSVPLLACGRDDSKICLYTEQQGQFALVQILTGHEQWIRGLSFTIDDNSDILLASCGKDCYIRLWRISERQEQPSESNLTITEQSELKLREVTFSVNAKTYAITLESVLLGHENWVYSVRWHPAVYTDGKRHQPLSLLSASMDKTVIVWQPHGESGIWMEKVRVGEVGGSNLGFYGGLFSADGKSIVAHGYQGAIHLWEQNDSTGAWPSTVSCGGHFGPVNDLVWGVDGEFLLSVSSDQTTRLHGPWSTAVSEDQRVWHELARPQIHGYDIQCVDMIDRFTFASGADEKVIRVFTAPKNFLENFQSITRADVADALKKMEGLDVAEGASVPALGLSNKAVYVGSDTQSHGSEKNAVTGSDDQYAESYFLPQHLSAPPSEENLLQNTLWPEIQKLYGHGNEVYAIACSPDGALLASACKATKSDQAVVILWDTATWRPLCQLESHSLTVTQIAFSHKGDMLLTVSRDRTWTVFKRRASTDPENDPIFRKVACADKKTAIHSRIIWSCAWSHDDAYFATVSRDKKAIIWNKSGSETTTSLGGWRASSAPLELSDSITAVDFSPVAVDESRYLLAFGIESGSIFLVTWTSVPSQKDSSWHTVHVLDRSMAHHLSVKRLRFCPKPEPNGTIKLASCAEDTAVKIFDIYLKVIQSCVS